MQKWEYVSADVKGKIINYFYVVMLPDGRKLNSGYFNTGNINTRNAVLTGLFNEMGMEEWELLPYDENFIVFKRPIEGK